MNNRENESRISHKAWRERQAIRMELNDDNGEGLDWLNPLACTEASEMVRYGDWRLPNVNEEHEEIPGARGVRFNTRYEGGPSGAGDERYYT